MIQEAMEGNNGTITLEEFKTIMVGENEETRN